MGNEALGWAYTAAGKPFSIALSRGPWRGVEICDRNFPAVLTLWSAALGIAMEKAVTLGPRIEEVYARD